MRDEQDNHLKLGKRSYFVKSQLKRLRQEDDIWEADFFPVPQQGLWIGLVISHTDDFVLAQRTIEQPPTVNDLARLLAEAMRRPLVEFSHRPRTLYIRERPEWAELLPHLKQVGIEVVYQVKLPKWDDAFGDLCAQLKGNGRAGGVGKKTRTKPKSPFIGRWHIVSMSEWEEDYFNEEVQAFIEFDKNDGGSFQFGYVQGQIDYVTTIRDGKPSVEFSWEGGDGADGTPLTGRGWAILVDDELRGLIFIHLGDDSEFVAKRAEAVTRKKTK